MLPEFSYLKATNVPHAVELLHNAGTGVQILAGGTDLIVDLRERRVLPATLIDISEVEELAAIRVEDDAIHIGGCATIASIGRHEAIGREFPALASAISSFADMLTRNKATLGGNVANASPGADLVVPLLALDASVVLAKHHDSRTLRLDQFLRGPRTTAIQPGELLVEVIVPRGAPAGQVYEKLGLKHGGTIAVVSSAVMLDASGDQVGRPRIALGAVAPRPFRSRNAEALLEGAAFGDQLADQAADLAAGSATPITDVRGSAEYRRAMVCVLVRRGIQTAWARARGQGDQATTGR